MLKDWFYYSKGERRVITLLLLVMAIIVSLMLVESTRQDETVIENNTLSLADSLLCKIEKSRPASSRDNVTHHKRNGRNNGNRLYKPLISQESSEKESAVPKYKKQEKFSEGTIVDLNTADTITLKKIPGIGSVISRNIVHYRERLGGFYSVNQIKEVKYADSTLIRWFKVETSVYRKLKINSDGFDILKSHPYMNYPKVKAILKYRERRGSIKNIMQLSVLKEFSAEDIDRLKHYIDFQ